MLKADKYFRLMLILLFLLCLLGVSTAFGGVGLTDEESTQLRARISDTKDGGRSVKDDLARFLDIALQVKGEKNFAQNLQKALQEKDEQRLQYLANIFSYNDFITDTTKNRGHYITALAREIAKDIQEKKSGEKALLEKVIRFQLYAMPKFRKEVLREKDPRDKFYINGVLSGEQINGKPVFINSADHILLQKIFAPSAVPLVSSAPVVPATPTTTAITTTTTAVSAAPTNPVIPPPTPPAVAATRTMASLGESTPVTVSVPAPAPVSTPVATSPKNESTNASASANTDANALNAPALTLAALSPECREAFSGDFKKAFKEYVQDRSDITAFKLARAYRIIQDGKNDPVLSSKLQKMLDEADVKYGEAGSEKKLNVREMFDKLVDAHVTSLDEMKKFPDSYLKLKEVINGVLKEGGVEEEREIINDADLYILKQFYLQDKRPDEAGKSDLKFRLFGGLLQVMLENPDAYQETQNQAAIQQTMKALRERHVKDKYKYDDKRIPELSKKVPDLQKHMFNRWLHFLKKSNKSEDGDKKLKECYQQFVDKISDENKQKHFADIYKFYAADAKNDDVADNVEKIQSKILEEAVKKAGNLSSSLSSATSGPSCPAPAAPPVPATTSVPYSKAKNTIQLMQRTAMGEKVQFGPTMENSAQEVCEYDRGVLEQNKKVLRKIIHYRNKQGISFARKVYEGDNKPKILFFNVRNNKFTPVPEEQIAKVEELLKPEALAKEFNYRDEKLQTELFPKVDNAEVIATPAVANTDPVSYFNTAQGMFTFLSQLLADNEKEKVRYHVSIKEDLILKENPLQSQYARTSTADGFKWTNLTKEEFDKLFNENTNKNFDLLKRNNNQVTQKMADGERIEFSYNAKGDKSVGLYFYPAKGEGDKEVKTNLVRIYQDKENTQRYFKDFSPAFATKSIFLRKVEEQGKSARIFALNPQNDLTELTTDQQKAKAMSYVEGKSLFFKVDVEKMKKEIFPPVATPATPPATETTPAQN